MSRKMLFSTAGLLALAITSSANAADYWTSNNTYRPAATSWNQYDNRFDNNRFDYNRYGNNWDQRDRFNAWNHASHYNNSRVVRPTTTYRPPVISTWTTPIQTYPAYNAYPYSTNYYNPGSSYLNLNCR